MCLCYRESIKTTWGEKSVTPVYNAEKSFVDSKQSITCIGAISFTGLLCMAVKTKENIDLSTIRDTTKK